MQRYCQNMSLNNIVPVNRFIVDSLYYIAILWRVCFDAPLLTSHAMKVVVLYKFCEDRAFYKDFDDFLVVLMLERFGNGCLYRFWFADMTSYAGIDHINHRVIKK